MLRAKSSSLGIYLHHLISNLHTIIRNEKYDSTKLSLHVLFPLECEMKKRHVLAING